MMIGTYAYLNKSKIDIDYLSLATTTANGTKEVRSTSSLPTSS